MSNTEERSQHGRTFRNPVTCGTEREATAIRLLPFLPPFFRARRVLEKETKSSLSIALVCTTRHRIPARTSTNEGSKKGELRVLRAAGFFQGGRVLRVRVWRLSSHFQNNLFQEMCSGSEAGSYLWLINFVCHSTPGLSVIQKKKKVQG